MTTEQAPVEASAAGTITIGGDMTVNRMGFGAMRITGEGIWGPPKDHDNAIRVLKRAVELGVNFIDTADAYGPNVSEDLIAEALHPYPTGLVIATKGGLLRTGPGQWPNNGKPEHLREALEGSLRRLKIDTIDLYQYHRPDPNVPIEDSIGMLVDLQKQGKIRHIGVSNFNSAQLAQARAIAAIVSVQNRYNVSDREDEDVLETCTRDGIAFLPWAPVASGDLTRPGGPVDKAAEHHKATQGQIALAWLLQRSPLVLPIPGTAQIAHLEENIAAAALKLDDDELKALNNPS